MPGILRVSRTRSHECSERLEPDIRERIRPVLRGGADGNAAPLSDTMRIIVMTQMGKGLEGKDIVIQSAVLKELERSKWYLWHGNVYEACISIDNLELLLDNDDALTAKRRSLLKALRDFRVYITTNARLIPNYGERWRYGEAIATGFVESTVNQVVSKRFVKKQQMK